MPRTKNRWLIALSAVTIQLSLGSAYAYSVFKKPLELTLGWSLTQTTLAFTVAFFCMGVSAAVFGRFVEKRGPRVSALLAAALFCSGLIGAGLAVSAKSLLLFYLAYGVIGGMGLGIGFLSPVPTLVRWFPDRRGLATGMAVMGFGAGALIASPIAARLMESVGVASTLYLLGAAYFVLMGLGASYIELPADGWMPAVMRGEGTASSDGPGRRRRARPVPADLAQCTGPEAVRTSRFWMLWLMMVVNISSGMMLIAVASEMAQEKAGISAIAAATMVGIMGLFNGGGRIGWASLSDYLGRPAVFTIFFAAQFGAFLVLPHVRDALLFQILLFTVLSMYGGGFASLPAFIGDLFGTKQLAVIQGYLMTAWSVAGVVGPMLVARIKETTGGYDGAFYAFAALHAVALITSLLLARKMRYQRLRTIAAAADTPNESPALKLKQAT